MRNNHIEAKMHLESLAKEGNADAQYALGYEYYHQKSQVREAIQWCMAAADKKHVLAQNYLHQTQFSAGIYYEIAILYVHGEGAAVNLPQALLFYEKAAKTGISHAYFNMGVIFEKSLKDIGMAFNYYLQAAKARDVEAIGAVIRLARSSSNNDWLFQVAELYDKSLDDKGQALNWYRDAARLNSPKAWQALAKEGNASNVNAAIYLAELCESGHVSMRQHAAGWHARASELGDSNASFRLGQAYEKAELGLTVNCSKAGEYYARAVKQQHPEALKAFEKLVDTILKTKEFINAAEMSMAKELYFEFAELCFNQVRNKELALKWYKIAVDRGHKGAISKINNICKADPHFSYALGLQYETGAEGTRDELKAFYLYAFAMRNGH
ncbi:MAG: sel1 repeat family protein, partial [Gammaproteobacteria bacterium]|nr:sel1 repeat family protein [Gammaproteobacteria bacterium]